MSESTTKRFGRRDAMVGMGLAAGAATGIVGAAGAQEALTPPPRPTPEGVEPPDTNAAHGLVPPDASIAPLLDGLEPGTLLEGHWRIESTYGIRAGAIPMVLSTTVGTRFAVEIFREDPSAARPLAQAPGLALYLVNRGDGARQTDEAVGLGVQALGRALAARVERGARVPSSLTSHGERSRRDPGGIYHVPL